MDSKFVQELSRAKAKIVLEKVMVDIEAVMDKANAECWGILRKEFPKYGEHVYDVPCFVGDRYQIKNNLREGLEKEFSAKFYTEFDMGKVN